MKERYCKLMDRCVPGEELVRAAVKVRRPARRRLRLGAAAAAAALAACFLATPVLAAAAPPFRAALYSVSPAAAQYFTPVQHACEDQGIRMEVLSVYIHGDTAEIYISLQDQTGNRIDETTDLFDSYDILRPYDSTATCRFAGYDAQTRTVLFLITITEQGGHRIEGDKVTFQVRRFLSHKEEQEGTAIPLSLGDLAEAPAGAPATLTGGSGALAFEEAPAVLTPGEPWEGFPVKGIDLTAAGYVDGKLHIQLAVEDYLDNDNHGWLYLKGAAGEIIEPVGTAAFCTEGNGAARVDYQEFVFDVSPEEGAECTLWGDFVTCSTLTEGSWRVTFPLRQSDTWAQPPVEKT